jgi:hypothetical protein
MKGVIAANRGSRGLSHLSTARYVSGLNFWVRDGSRCFPAAMAAITVYGRRFGIFSSGGFYNPLEVEDLGSSPGTASYEPEPKPRSGFEPECSRSAGDRVTAPPPWQVVYCSISAIKLGEHSWISSGYQRIKCWLALDVSNRGLNTSLPSCLYPGPIKRIFYPCPQTKSLFRSGFKLRCFQLLSLIA